VDRRFRRQWLLLCVIALGSICVLRARVAAAAPNDAAAQKLRDQAIDQDYLATDFAAAEKKLTDALNLCKKTSDCSPFIRARLHCDLGVVEFMLKKIDLARTEFATALVEDPGVTLDTNLSNTDVQREFAAIKSGGPPPPGPGTSPGASAPGAGAPSQGAPGQAAQTGVTHTPPARQAVRTPLPLYVEVAEDITPAKVVLRYKPVGAKDWKSLAMRPMERGFGAEIPCNEVGDREGDLEYYIQALDANGDLVAASGRSAAPHKVAIVQKLEGEPPHFPNQTPPHACAAGGGGAEPSAEAEATTKTTEASDCPPGFPGCHGEGPTSCDSADDCVSGEACVDHVCQRGEAEDKEFKKNWLSIAVEAEDLIMPGADNACAGGQGYTCFQAGTSTYYGGTPALGRDDQVLGGLATSPMVRILLGYDRVVQAHVTAGVRLGYAVFGSGPQRPGGAAFMPVHAEARLAYWFGKNVFSRKGLRPYVVLGAGLAEVDASQGIDVLQNATTTTRTPVDAWTKTGNGFGALGLGAMFAFTRSSGLVLEARGMLLFPTFGSALAAQLAYAVGL